jgi:NADPH:quinone reductase-like Zn-dependent oxidoreductase
MTSAYQIKAAQAGNWRSLLSLENLQLNKAIPKPSNLEPQTVLVRIRAVALNARDLRCIAHDPVLPSYESEDLTPCIDGAGDIEALGDGGIWKIGEKVMIHPNGWMNDMEPMTMSSLGALGGGDTEGTLRQYAVLVRLIEVLNEEKKSEEKR